MRQKGLVAFLMLGLLAGCQSEKPTDIGTYTCGDNLKVSIKKDESTMMIGKDKHKGSLKRLEDGLSTVEFKELGNFFYDTSKKDVVHIQQKKNGEYLYTCTLVKK